MAHRDHHPRPVDGCFGCKVSAVAYDGGHLTRSTMDENRATITEHRDGRQDVIVRPQGLVLKITSDGVSAG